MVIVSYDIKDTKLRTKFSKMLTKNGAVRLQMSVYEVNNSKRYLDKIILEIENHYSKSFGGDDSVVVFEMDNIKVRKYGNAIHRDKDIVFL